MKLLFFAAASAGAAVLVTLILVGLASHELEEYDPYEKPFGMP